MNDVPDRSPNDTWVVGVDGSEAGDRAVGWATRHVDGRAAKVEVVAAWESSLSLPSPSRADGQHDAEPPYAAAAVELAASAAARFGVRDGLDVTHRATHGGASAVLLDAADDADLLIVGNRGRGGFRRLVLGSTSAQCATHSVGPMVIVREARHSGPERLVVGFDGSENSYAAVDWALRFAAPGSTVTIAMGWDPSLANVSWGDVMSLSTVATAAAAFSDWMATMLVGYGEYLGALDIELEAKFSVDSPRDHLKELADRSSLLVVGARGHGAVGSLVLGSVSTWLLHHVEVPMALVPAAITPS